MGKNKDENTKTNKRHGQKQRRKCKDKHKTWAKQRRKYKDKHKTWAKTIDENAKSKTLLLI